MQSFWHIYVWVFAGILVLSAIGRFLIFLRRRDLVQPIELVEAILGLLAVPALFGFAYQQRLGSPLLWMALCVVLGVASVNQFFSPKMKKIYLRGWLPSIATIGIQALISAPAIWALVRYAFFSR
ncbi:hypothetical protein [Silvibacterium sp.]|uniref:hypothetical protein n=1 Tax=Silvibacterium sp. TaxID=1964179 RepID=UPI0039E49DD0